ncbi:MAG: 50S ribosomal protein L44e [Candidatus Aenigmarchaeota archaeon]|nr:50S ribosomal protein L44e [Candidatus Aenigmarchaeota archaeon]
MKFAKKIRVYCPYCRSHQIHEVSIIKKKPKRALAIGQRRFLRKLRGYTSFPKPKPEHEKPTKRVDLRFKCKECGKSHVRGAGWRAKKFELI